MEHFFCQFRHHLISLSPYAPGFALVLAVILSSSSTAWGQGPEVEWTVQISTDEFDEALGITAYSEGVYVVGATSDPSPGNPSIGGGLDALISNYDFDGGEIWSRKFGTPGLDRAIGVATGSSAIYVVGSTSGTFSGQTKKGGNLDAFLSKRNLQGARTWTRQFGTLGRDQAQAVAVDASGVYVTGTVNGPSPGYSIQSGPDVFVRKYDFDGNLAWSHEFGTMGTDHAQGLIVHSSGVYVAGTVGGALPRQQSAGGDTDVFIRKYNFTGNEVWTRQLGTLGSDQALAIAAGPEALYVVGTTTGTFPGLPNVSGGRDAFVTKYDFEGGQLWVRQFGTRGHDEALAIFVDREGVYITGNTSGAFPGYDSPGGGLDAFLLKYTGGGNRVWTMQFETSETDRLSGATRHLDRFYILGNTTGAFPTESDGFITSLVVPEAGQPESIPPTPTPTLAPTPTPAPTLMPIPVPTSTPGPTLMPSPVLPPTLLPAETPGPAPTSTPLPTETPTPVPGATPLPRPTATATPVPTPEPTATPRPTATVVPYTPPESTGPSLLQQVIILGGLGVIGIIAIIGILRNR